MIHCTTKSGALGFEWVLNRSNPSVGPAPAYLDRWIVGSRKGCRGDATIRFTGSFSLLGRFLWLVSPQLGSCKLVDKRVSALQCNLFFSWDE